MIYDLQFTFYNLPSVIKHDVCRFTIQSATYNQNSLPAICNTYAVPVTRNLKLATCTSKTETFFSYADNL